MTISQLTPTASNNWPQEERGAALIVFAVALVGIIALTAIGFDLSFAFEEQRRIHFGTDAGAVTAAEYLDGAGTNIAEVKLMARAVANENGVPFNELDAAAGLDGSTEAVEVGHWNPATQAFTNHNAAIGGATPTNAVRVLARRTHPAFFAWVFGVTQLQPTVVSVAIKQPPGPGPNGNSVLCGAPFGIEQSMLVGKNIGDQVKLEAQQAPGNWGKLDIGGNMSAGPNFIEAMTEGTTCDNLVSTGNMVSPGTGFAGLGCGWQGRQAADPIVILPVVREFHNGNQDVEIVGFINVELRDQSGKCKGQGGGVGDADCDISAGKDGNNWMGCLKLVGGSVGIGDLGGGGGGTDPTLNNLIEKPRQLAR